MESGLSADKKVEQLSEEELHCVLKQLTDHNLPNREKCPLVQRLIKNKKPSPSSPSSSLLPVVTNGRSSNRSSVKSRSRMHILSKENELESNNNNNNHHHHYGSTPSPHHPHANNHQHIPRTQSSCRDKPVNYAQSLQELRTTNCDESQNLAPTISNRNNTEIVATPSHLRSGGNRKPNRANSFTMPSQSDNSTSKNDNTFNKILDHHHHRLTNGAEVSPESLRRRCADKQTLSGSSPLSISSTAPQSCSNSSHSPSADHFQPFNKKPTCSLNNNYSSVHLASISSLVDSINSDSVSSYPRLLSDRGLNKSNSQSLTVQEEDEERIEFGEMKNLQSQAQFI